jgi:excisionase family DNA binding protein
VRATNLTDIHALPTPLKHYFRVAEVAEYFAISVRTVYRLIDEGQLNRTRIRGCPRVPLAEIRRYERELEGRMGEG